MFFGIINITKLTHSYVLFIVSLISSPLTPIPSTLGFKSSIVTVFASIAVKRNRCALTLTLNQFELRDVMFLGYFVCVIDDLCLLSDGSVSKR